MLWEGWEEGNKKERGGRWEGTIVLHEGDRVGEGHAQFRMRRRLKCTKKAGSEHAPRENLNLLQLSSSSEMDRNTSKTVIL